MSKWEEFERIIADIQKQADPDAVVRHNHRIKGKSGRMRQLDVTISKKVGTYPILIVIECKHYRRPVGIEKVEAFVTKLRDVGAFQGMMVSNSGFDEGAKAAAKDNSITLVSYRKAADIDWHSLVDSQAKAKVIVTGIEGRFLAFINEDDIEIRVGPEAVLCNSKGDNICTTREFYTSMEEGIGLSLDVGPFAFKAIPPESIFIRFGDEAQRVKALILGGVNKAWEHSIDLALASGDVLENINNGEAIYNQAITQSVEWQEILAQPSREISKEEYEENHTHRKFFPTPMRVDHIKGSFKVVITKK